MKIGLIDCDLKNQKNPFPNLALMKISAWHKKQGDQVEWYFPFSGEYDKVYVSKVFSFSDDYEYVINAKEVSYGGTGFAISLIDGKEVYDKKKDKSLPDEIEHIYPDYSIYGITDTAYGFMSRGCPRGCDFCHVKDKEGLRSVKVADLSEFWSGQKYISLYDPNTLACKDWKDILQQLADSNAYVDFNQGVDIRLMTEEKAKYLKKIKVKQIHFAFDRYEDKDIVMPRLKTFANETNWGHKVSVYVLCNFNTSMEQNLERIMFIRSLNFNPYVMIYNKQALKKGDPLRKLQRWCNNKILFWRYMDFEDYLKNEKETH